MALREHIKSVFEEEFGDEHSLLILDFMKTKLSTMIRNRYTRCLFDVDNTVLLYGPGLSHGRCLEIYEHFLYESDIPYIVDDDDYSTVIVVDAYDV